MISAGGILDRCERVGDCMIWQGALNSKGYGSVKAYGRSMLAHRFIFTEMVGPIEDGLTVDHLCREPRCMNVFHMELVTAGENSRRKNEAQTHCKEGHALEGENVRLQKRSSGLVHRVCRTCHAAHVREYNARVKARTALEKAVA